MEANNFCFMLGTSLWQFGAYCTIVRNIH